jgi:hypothetical protein
MVTKQLCGVAEKLNSCILEKKLLNFGCKTGYPERGFSLNIVLLVYRYVGYVEEEN